MLNSSTELSSDTQVVTAGAPGLTTTSEVLVNEVPFEYRIMSKSEMAAYLGITERTIEIWMRRRMIPFIKLGRTVRFRVDSVLRYVDEKYTVSVAGSRRRP